MSRKKICSNPEVEGWPLPGISTAAVIAENEEHCSTRIGFLNGIEPYPVQLYWWKQFSITHINKSRKFWKWHPSWHSSFYTQWITGFPDCLLKLRISAIKTQQLLFLPLNCASSSWKCTARIQQLTIIACVVVKAFAITEQPIGLQLFLIPLAVGARRDWHTINKWYTFPLSPMI